MAARSEGDMDHRKSRAAAGSIAAAFLVTAMLPMGVATAASPKEAEFFELQWNLEAIGAHSMAHYTAEAMAAAAEDAPEVLVAVVDTGIAYTHPDLGIAVNADGSEGDGGRVDLHRSVSLIGARAAVGSVCEANPDPRESGVVAGEREPGMPYGALRTTQRGDLFEEETEADNRGLEKIFDFHSHGTGVSGLIASNAEYLAGLTQHTTLFGVKVHGMGRQNCLSVYIKGIYEAADRGADVIHLSYPLEWDAALTEPFNGQDAVDRVNRALDYAHDKGAVVVTPAGNGGTDMIGDDLDVGTTFRFCEGRWVVCVSATGTDSAATVKKPYWDESPVYTNFGEGIDVAGPGGTPAVQVPLTCSRVTLFGGAPQAPCRAPASGFIWHSNGTSFGAAATSGLAALIVRLTGSDDPCMIEQILEQSSDDLGTSGFDDYYGEGRINVKRATRLATLGGWGEPTCD
jgi:subtilisin family serine protease